VSDPFVRYIVGDALGVLRSMPDASVDLVLTSPPFLALRSYLPADDPAKPQEMGSETTPGEFIDALLDIVEECRRVLAPHGSLCFELGDTYSGSGGAGGDYGEGGLRDGQPKFKSERKNKYDKRYELVGGRTGPGRTRAARDGWPLDKSLCLAPELLRVAMVYGFNPLTGRETQRWRARNVVRWCRPNPPVGALADKFRPATSEIVVACMGRARFFDLDAVRVPFTGHPGVGTGVRKGQNGDKPEDNRPNDLSTRRNTHDGAPPLDWWEVSTEPYKGSHYATWPTKLVVRPIEAMCPQRVCIECGKPSERIAETVNATGKASVRNRSMADRKDGPVSSTVFPRRAERETRGWTDCGCEGGGVDRWRPGVVLDPFAGSGTTLAVAIGHGRSAIGIDLDRRNVELARERVGMWLEVDGENGSPTIDTVDVAGGVL
jgi:site-specific DNA-methyltransferase (adenine-specific)